MAIIKIIDPSALPITTGDYVQQNVNINVHTLNLNQPYPVVSNYIIKGATFNIGGDLYYTNANTTITGVESDYVKIVPGATEATAEYVSGLAGVGWNDVYNGYYDGSGNLYLFNEAQASLDEEISEFSSYRWRSLAKRAVYKNFIHYGTGFSIVTAQQYSSIAALSNTTLAVYDGLTSYNLRYVVWDGSSFTQVGNSLNLSAQGAITALDDHTVAFINSTNSRLSTYSFDGTDWALVGNHLTITGVGVAAITALDDHTVVIASDGNNNLATYAFDGTNWALVGAALGLGAIAVSAIAALTSSSIAFIDSGNNSLRKYNWSGSAWSTEGSWKTIDTIGNPAMAALDSTTIVLIGDTLELMRTYKYSGGWVQTGDETSIPNITYPALAALDRNTTVMIDGTSRVLTTLGRTIGFVL